MTAASNCPLVTFAVIAYNQEQYIREAIEGAFAQTYQPLEIILSDDCSPDRTFEIMEEMTKTYDGPHRVILNRNKTNIRLAPHIDRVVELTSGELIVANAGDDVSAPERVKKLAETWLASNKKLKLMHSSARQINFSGEYINLLRPPERMIKNPTAYTIACQVTHVIGATAAWDRSLFTEFGPLGAEVSCEDRILPFRAALLGEIAYLDEPLVSYRVGGVSSHVGPLTAWGYMYGISHKLRKWNLEQDLHILSRFAHVSYPDKPAIEETCRRRVLGLQFHVDLAEGSFLRRIKLAPRALQIAVHDKSIVPIKHWLRYVFDQVYIAYSDWKSRRKRQAMIISSDSRLDP